jgi:hypothetical protein
VTFIHHLKDSSLYCTDSTRPSCCMFYSSPLELVSHVVMLIHLVVVLVHLVVFLVHSAVFLVYHVVVLVLPAVIMSRWRRNPLVSHTTTGVNIAADTAHPLATISATPADKQMPRSMVLQTTEPCSRWLTSKCHGVLYYRPQNFVLFGLNQTTLA